MDQFRSMRYPRGYSVYRNGLLKKIRMKGNCRADDDVKLKDELIRNGATGSRLNALGLEPKSTIR
jgi:hypothetical protein